MTEGVAASSWIELPLQQNIPYLLLDNLQCSLWLMVSVIDSELVSNGHRFDFKHESFWTRVRPKVIGVLI